LPDLVSESSAASFAVAQRNDAQLREAAHRAGLALSVEELRRIADRLGRDPTLVEVYAFDAQWSEHCSYKSSRSYLRRLPTDGPTVMQGPQEDAGVLHLGEWNGERYGIVIAHESHNHPSQVVPFEGAATGVGGIVRDVLCMGATVVAIADPLRFGDLGVAHSRYVAQGVVDGIAAYGNAIGVPNIAGDVYFDAAFNENVLVNVVALGLVREGEIIHSRAPAGAAGWDIVLVGKATDRSGFGGASFSSLALDSEDADANKGAVQVPDPFLKNVIMRASYCVFELLRSEGIEAGFKDLGAGGIVGCTAELAASGGFGAIVDLDRAPTAQPNLPAPVVAIGETQERLCWIVPPSITPRVLSMYNDVFGLPGVSRGARAAVIGTVAEGNEYVARWEGRELMRVPLDFLTGGIRYERAVGHVASLAGPEEARPIDVGDVIELVLAHHDVCSRQPIFSRYDGVVRGTTAIPPGYADAGVILPIPDAPLACALAVDGNPRYGKIDPRRAAELAVCEAVRNVVAVGATPAGLTDCLNFGNPEKPEHFAQFVAAVDGLAQAGRELETPFVSGNVSLYNESASGRAIPPSPIVACVGTIADISKTATCALKAEGSTLFLVGRPQNALGGSVLASILGIDGTLPTIDYASLRAQIKLVLAAYESNIVLAAHDVSDGGIVTAIAEMAFASRSFAPLGVKLEPPLRWAPDVGGAGAFFGEAGAFIVEVQNTSRFHELTLRCGASAARLGETIRDPALILAGKRYSVERLYEAWSAPLCDFYGDGI
jgi:phosphoribosylformylglycinamidine synthase subunit PurL